jgi:DnaJ-class molecular chaperone
VSEIMSVPVLMQWLAEAAEAREWRLRLESAAWPARTRWRCSLIDGQGFGLFSHTGETAQEALAGTWAELARWSRGQASRGRRTCPACRGEGQVLNGECTFCGGRGLVAAGGGA